MNATEYLSQPFYSPAEAAPLMRVTLRTLRSLIRTGKIKTAKGKTKLISETEIARYLGFDPVANGRQ